MVGPTAMTVLAAPLPAALVYNIIYIYIYRVYVDSHSLGQLALASKRTASFIKLQPRLDSKRNRRWRRLETKPVEIITKHCLLLFAPSIKRYSRNRIASKYHYHASAYSLQTICCRFIYLHEENANADNTDNSSRLPG